jgi:hypothetical protein
LRRLEGGQFCPQPAFSRLKPPSDGNCAGEFHDLRRLNTRLLVSSAEANEPYKNIEWELEDLLGVDLLSAFCEEHPNAISRECRAADLVHRDFTRDGKARLHRFANDHAMRRDLIGVTGVLKAFRRYLGLPENGAADSSNLQR